MSSDDSGSDFGDNESMFSDAEVVAKPKKAAPKKAAAPKKPAAAKKATAASKKRAASDDESESGAAKKQKKAPAPKKPAAKSKKPAVAMDIDEDDDDAGAGLDIEDEARVEVAAANGNQKRTVDEVYKKLSQTEHILKRPDTYIGSVEPTEKHMWVFDSATEMMSLRNITVVPGLYKIFDEILVNAADNKMRDPNMDTIKVTIDREKNEISVWNNGKGIPIEMHKTEGVWAPQLIFGVLLTSSNYDDDEKKLVGGRNGFGAKLCNVFSTEFTVETADKEQKKKYTQTWKNNMEKRSEPVITKHAKNEEYTKITFKPDLAKFGMTEMDQDLEDLLKRRVYDLAGVVKNVKVFLNGTRITKVKNFKSYCEMYVKALREESDGNEKLEIIHAVVNDRWEIAFACSNGSFQQVSFVNSIATTSGGTHVDHVATQLCTKLESYIKRKNKTGTAVKNAQMRNHFFLFVNCLIENPAFSAQTKEQLTTKQSAFGSKCPLPDDFVKKVVKTEVINNIVEFANMKAEKALKKTDGGARRSRIHNPNLTDANKAGTKNSQECVLILTEGLSASGLARAGIASISGHDRYGVFPLRGKVLNVRDATHDQIAKNAEITQLKQILGLQHKKVYESTKELRYGHIMIMTDQDHDGSHIKGLLINFFEAQFPSLLKLPDFLIEFITPIVKVFKGDIKKPKKQISFFTMPEYEYWKENNTESGWKHKYYKGLGTSGDEDAKVYFADLDKHMKYFEPMEDEGKRLVELAFSKSKADERKEWLRTYQPGTYLDHTMDMISYPDFINKELILFSIADCARSIPSVVDGLKPGQRKILFGAFKRNLKNEIKVVQLAGYVSEHTGYHHGEVSLQSTITAMAQTFAGSNNVNLLDPSGNFGSRLQGGKDAASARYIYTSLSHFARKVLPPHDDRLLTYNDEDGQKIEPCWYVPVLPMILINGAEGIGTGWSSSIPSYNPKDVVANLKRMMEGKEMEPMTPWYRGWTGTVEKLSDHKFKFNGVIRQIDELRVEVTELPIKMWTQSFKEKLEEIIKGEKTPSFIKDYVDYNSPSKVHFIITMESEAAMRKALEEGLENKFKLSSTVATTNLVAFDPEGRINRYNTVEDIMKEFYFVRLKYYQRRKEVLLVDLNAELRRLSNQARFIQMIIKKELVVAGKKRPEIISQLQKHGFEQFSKKKDAEAAGETEQTLEESEEGDEDSEKKEDKIADGYNYLLGMAIWTLTWEKAQKLLQDVANKEAEIDVLMKKSPKDLWAADLDEFLEAWEFQLKEDIRLAKTVIKKRPAGARARVTKGKNILKKKKGEDDSDDDFDASPKAKKKAPAKKQTTLPFAPESPAKKPAARAATKKPIVVDDDDASDLGDSDLEMLGPQKKPAAAKPAAKPKVEQPPEPPKEMDLDDDDLEILSKPKAPAKMDTDGDSFATADEPPSPKAPAAVQVESDESDFGLTKPKKAEPKKAEPKKAPAAKGKAAAKPKSKAPASDDDDDDASMFDFDGEDVAPAKPRAKRAAAKKPALVDDDSDEDQLGDVSLLVKGVGEESNASSRPLFAASSKPTGSKAAAAIAAAAKKAAAKPATKLLSDSEDDLPKPKAKKAPAKKAAPAKKPAAKKKAMLSDDDEDMDIAPPAKKPAAKKKAIVLSDDEDDMDIDTEVNKLLSGSDEEMAEAPAAKPKKAAAAKPAAKPKAKPVVEDSPPPAPRARAGRGRAAAAKPVAYKIDDSDDEEEEEAASEEDYDDEDDDY